MGFEPICDAEGVKTVVPTKLDGWQGAVADPGTDRVPGLAQEVHYLSPGQVGSSGSEGGNYSSGGRYRYGIHHAV